MKKMGMPLRKPEEGFTYKDYKSWPPDERWEIIRGIAWNMSAAANRYHQEISGVLFNRIYTFLAGKPCRVYHASFDVLLPDNTDQNEDDVATVVQPDISVICDPNKLTVQGCTGAPDWIIEILSPYTSKKDVEIKFHLYEQHGVKEYWIVDPGNRYVHVYLLGADGKYPMEPQVFLDKDSIACTVLEGLRINLEEVFALD
ncbi:MAG: Uma2 family endonuclease [Spirochaetota bacterium]